MNTNKKKLAISLANLDVLKNVKENDLKQVTGAGSALPTPHDAA